MRSPYSDGYKKVQRALETLAEQHFEPGTTCPAYNRIERVAEVAGVSVATARHWANTLRNCRGYERCRSGRKYLYRYIGNWPHPD